MVFTIIFRTFALNKTISMKKTLLLVVAILAGASAFAQKKGEPEWLLDFRLKAFRYWQTLEQPTWGHVHLPAI